MPKKSVKQYFPVVLFIILCKVVLSFESVDEILTCNHSNVYYWEVLSFHYAVQSGSNFWVCGRNLIMTIHLKPPEQYFPMLLIIMKHKVVLCFEFVEETLMCDYSY